MHYLEFQRERINGQLTLQFQPSDAVADHRRRDLLPEPVGRAAHATRATWLNRPFSRVEFDGNDQVATADLDHRHHHRAPRTAASSSSIARSRTTCCRSACNARSSQADRRPCDYSRRAPFGSQGAAEQPARPFVDAGGDRPEGRRRPDAVGRRRLPRCRTSPSTTTRRRAATATPTAFSTCPTSARRSRAARPRARTRPPTRSVSTVPGTSVTTTASTFGGSWRNNDMHQTRDRHLPGARRLGRGHIGDVRAISPAAWSRRSA